MASPVRALAAQAGVVATAAGDGCLAMKMHMPCPTAKSGLCKQDQAHSITVDDLLAAGHRLSPSLRASALETAASAARSIRTENAQLVAYVYVDMHGRDLGGFVSEIPAIYAIVKKRA